MKTAVLLSGGVDSSVALRLLRDQGHDVTAFYLKVWLQEELSFLGDCPWEEDLRYARAVCTQLGVPLEVVPLQDAYYQRVVSYVLAELRAGHTPSPDVFCNTGIKFGAFVDLLAADYGKVATGHYAQVEERAGAWWLRRSPDPVKDQSYFLSRLSQEQLRRAWFPIGACHKHEVRALARQFGLPTQDRPDSQGICFLGRIKYHEFIRYHLGTQPGPIVDRDTGGRLGEHQGLWFHTIGQRQGLGLSGGPWYVAAKDLTTNTLYVSHRLSPRPHGARRFTFVACHRIVPGAELPSRLLTKLRHGPKLWTCALTWGGPDCGEIELDEPDSGLAPGQMAVLYDGEYCLGNAIIADPLPAPQTSR